MDAYVHEHEHEQGFFCGLDYFSVGLATGERVLASRGNHGRHDTDRAALLSRTVGHDGSRNEMTGDRASWRLLRA